MREPPLGTELTNDKIAGAKNSPRMSSHRSLPPQSCRSANDQFKPFRFCVGNVGLRQHQPADPHNWVDHFIDFYLGDRLSCELDQSCGLQSLTADVTRSDDPTRARYKTVFAKVADLVAAGLT